MCTRFLWQNQKERDHLEDHGLYGRILGILAGGALIGSSCLRIGTGGGLV
jgi:hypothetical protein